MFGVLLLNDAVAWGIKSRLFFLSFILFTFVILTFKSEVHTAQKLMKGEREGALKKKVPASRFYL